MRGGGVHDEDADNGMGWEVNFTEWLEEQASTMNSLENKEEEITAMELEEPIDILDEQVGCWGELR